MEKCNFAIPKDKVFELLVKQLSNNFLLEEIEKKTLYKYYDEVLERTIHCISCVKNKYNYKDNIPYFNPYHSVQYMIFLYFYANTLYKNSESTLLCDRIYYLNKLLNSVDIFYAVDLPEFFASEHPVGAVLGRASYASGFVFFQNCTVGGYLERDKTISYPILGENVYMYANSKIIGKCVIGSNVNIGPSAEIKNCNIPSNTTVFGQSPNLIIKKNKIN